MMADQSWAIRQRAVKAGDRFSGTAVQTPARQVGWTSHEESTAIMHMIGEAAEQSSRQQLALVGAADCRAEQINHQTRAKEF